MLECCVLAEVFGCSYESVLLVDREVEELGWEVLQCW
jgi:hypothetical protein